MGRRDTDHVYWSAPSLVDARRPRPVRAIGAGASDALLRLVSRAAARSRETCVASRFRFFPPCSSRARSRRCASDRRDRRRRGDRRAAAGAATSGHDDTVYAFGTASFHGSTSGKHLNAPIVGMASTANGKGYWLVANDGGIFAFNAPFFGSLGAMAPATRRSSAWPRRRPARATGSSRGDGGVFTFGDANFYGSTGAMHLNAPITQIIAGPERQGLLADGAATAACSRSGRRAFHGSTGAKRLNAPVVGMTATPNGGGYLLVASDGGVFTFGNAQFRGSTGSMHVASPVVGIGGHVDRQRLLARDARRRRLHLRRRASAGRRDRAPGATAQIIQITACPGTRATGCSPAPNRSMIAPPLGLGSTGAAVTSVQKRLLALGYWMPGVDRRLRLTHPAGRVRVPEGERPAAHRRRSTSSRTTELRTATRSVPRSTSGYVIEIDKTRQILIVANGGRTAWVFNALDGFRPPVHARRRRGTPRTRPRGCSHHPRRSTATTRARSASCTGRSTSPTPGSRCTATPTCRRIPRRTVACASRTPAIDCMWGEQHPADRRRRVGVPVNARGCDEHELMTGTSPTATLPAPSGATARAPEREGRDGRRRRRSAASKAAGRSEEGQARPRRRRP